MVKKENWQMLHPYLEMALYMAYAKPSNVHKRKNELRSCTYMLTVHKLAFKLTIGSVGAESRHTYLVSWK
jgi:hypothetical protein